MRIRLVIAVIGALFVSLWAPALANASGFGYPLERPAGDHEVAATSTSFTITTNNAPHALQYYIYASTSKASLYVANITSKTKTAVSTTPTVRVSGLKYTGAPYFYRMRTVHGNSYRWGAIHAAGLQPAVPTDVQIASGKTGVYLTWANQDSAGFAVTQATDAAMTANRTTTVVWGHHNQFTPLGLTKGTTYYFQVRARNTGAYSGYSSVLHATAPASQQGLRVVTYNILMGTTVGMKTTGETYKSWAARRAGVAALLKQSKGDVLAIQEGNTWASKLQGYGGTRQVDDLARLLPGYTLATTEVPPTQHGYVRTGSYIFYRTAAYKPVTAGNHWTLDTGHYAAYQILQNRTSGAKFLFVSAHLIAGHSTALDNQRRAQTDSLLRQAKAYAAAHSVPVVYAGDFNSTINTNYAVDGPGNAMRAADVIDARAVALKRYNQTYNSANLYLRTPPQQGHSIDYIYTGPGVAAKYWGVIANLKAGKFVGTIPSDHDPVWSNISVPV